MGLSFVISTAGGLSIDCGALAVLREAFLVSFLACVDLVEGITVSTSAVCFLSGSVRGGNCSRLFRDNVVTIMLPRFSVEEELSLDESDESEELENLEELSGVFRIFFPTMD